MPVNLYDSPAQAQFINTYVPIQFEGLYKVADKAQKNLDEIEALQDDVITNYSSINTPFAKDKANYNSKYAQVQNWTNSNITSSEDLKDPLKQAEYKSIIRRFKGDKDLKSMLENAKAGKEFKKASDPRWAGVEFDKYANWDSSKDGSFEATPTPYEELSDATKFATDELKPSITGHDPKNPYYFVKEIRGKDVENAIDANLSTIADKSSVEMQYQKALKLGKIPDSYTLKDKSGNVIGYDKYKYIRDASVAAHSDKIVRDLEPDQVAMMMYKEKQDWARAVYSKKKEATADLGRSPVAQEIGRISNDISNSRADYIGNYILSNYKADAKGNVVIPKYLHGMAKEYVGYKNASENMKKINTQLETLKATPNYDKKEESKLVDLFNKNKENSNSFMSRMKDRLDTEITLSHEGKSNNIPQALSNQLSKSNVNEYILGSYYNKKYHGSKATISSDDKNTFSGYAPKATHDFTLINENSGLGVNSTAGWSKQIQSALVGNKFVGSSVFTPGNVVMLAGTDRDGNKIGHNISKLRVPENVFSAATGISKDDIETLGKSGLVHVEGKLTGKRLVSIPVSDNIFSDSEAVEATDADVIGSGFGQSYYNQLYK